MSAHGQRTVGGILWQGRGAPAQLASQPLGRAGLGNKLPGIVGAQDPARGARVHFRVVIDTVSIGPHTLVDTVAPTVTVHERG